MDEEGNSQRGERNDDDDNNDDDREKRKIEMRLRLALSLSCARARFVRVHYCDVIILLYLPLYFFHNNAIVFNIENS